MVGTFGGLQQTQVAVLRLSNWSVLKRLKEEGGGGGGCCC